MAGKDCHVVLIAALLASARLAAGAPDWAADLRRGLDDMTHDIQEKMQGLYAEQDLNEQLVDIIEQVENLPRDPQGHVILNGPSISMSKGRVTINGRTYVNDGNNLNVIIENGLTRIITPGRTSDGEPYVRKIEERSDEKYFYHIETFYNPKNNETTERIRWKLDRTTPGAMPEKLAEEK